MLDINDLQKILNTEQKTTESEQAKIDTERAKAEYYQAKAEREKAQAQKLNKDYEQKQQKTSDITFLFSCLISVSGIVALIVVLLKIMV